MLGVELSCQVEINVPYVRLGSRRAAWDANLEGLTPASVVYSAGVGTDLSFDFALIERTGAVVHAFDPTPKSIAWVREIKRPANFLFHPFGILDQDGTAELHLPGNPDYVSGSVCPPQSIGRGSESVPMHRLATIMQMLGHTGMDLLKLDVEGAEYRILDDMLRSPILPKQLLVEFHHRLYPHQFDLDCTRQMLQRLHASGYRIFAISDLFEEYSFKLDAGRLSP